jgi:hypothetical protein
VEKLRDPSHNRLIPPREWRGYCEQAGLAVVKQDIDYRKQPDLEWYFQAAATPEENRDKVRGLIATVPPGVREQYRVAEEDGKTVWWWPMLRMLARKPE